MLADLLREIVSLARESKGIEIATHKDLPETVFVRQGEANDTFPVPPARRANFVHGYADLVAATKDGELVVADPEGGGPEIFHDHGGIVLHLERLDRRDQIKLLLRTSDRFRTLEKLMDMAPMTQQEALRMLRYGLHGTGVEKLIAALRKLDFSRKSDGKSHIEHGRESLGRSVEAAVQQASEIPEIFMVSTPVYNNPGFAELTTVEVWCGLTLDMESSPVRIEIRPLADELSSAITRAQAGIGAKLAEDLPKVPIFNGRPT